MHEQLEVAFGSAVRSRRRALGLSQADLARRLGGPQSNVSRLERGQRSPTLRELMALAKVFNAPVSDLLRDWECALSAQEKSHPMVREPAAPYCSVPALQEALASEEAVLTQLAAHGVRFLGTPSRAAVFKLSLEETLLAAFRYSEDPRLFEALPALVLRNVQNLDWNRLVTGVFMLQLQNRLGMVVAASLQLKNAAPGTPRETWHVLEEVHHRLSKARLDREEVVGPKPKTREALEHLMQRTPAWLRAWRGLGAVDLDSLRRYLPR